MNGTVFLVDDDEAVRRSLCDILLAEGYLVRAFETAESLLEACHAEDEGCIVLDMRLPGMDGLKAQTHLNMRGIRLPILFLTGHGDVPQSVRAMKAGAFDFLQKPVAAELLLKRINAALAQDQSRHQARRESAEARARLARLTTREQDVLKRMLLGESSKEIARALDLSPRTVDVHRKNIQVKCRAAHLLELHALAKRAQQ